MATNHDVNFKADGPVTVERIVNEDNGCVCLKIGSTRQMIQVIMTADQAAQVETAYCGDGDEPEPDMDDRSSSVTAPSRKKPPKKKTAKKPSKKPSKKTTKKKG